MANDNRNIFGWDLLYGSIESDIKTNEDILVCLTHLILISKGFKCIGLGESNRLDVGNTASKSEMLPKGWNQHEYYALRYVYQGKLYNLKATKNEEGEEEEEEEEEKEGEEEKSRTLTINLYQPEEGATSLIQLNTNLVSTKKKQNNVDLDQMIPNNKQIIDMINCQLIEKILNVTKKRDTSSQTAQQATPPTRHYSDQFFTPTSSGSYDPLGMGGVPDPVWVGVGRNDLDPLGGLGPSRAPDRIIRPFGGGGMLFQPPPAVPRYPSGGGNLGVPPGAVPPGARFDPFRAPDPEGDLRWRNDPDQLPPGGPRGRYRPDNDEMPPPGYEDMFN